MKKVTSILLVGILIISTLTGCKKAPEYNKYSDTFFDTFDTITQIVGYTKTEEEFKGYSEKIHNRFLELHKLYDKYNNYEGINNVKTINDNAGIKPVKVEKELLDLITFSLDMYEKTGKETNIAMGAVLNIWSEYRDKAEMDPSNAKIPPMDILEEANKHTDINKVIVDVENSTVYLK